MVEAFVAFGGFRALVGRHFRVNAGRQRQRVDHHPFRGTRMHVVADNLDGNRGRVKVLKLQLAHTTAVYGIGPLGVKGFNIKVLRPFADLFIRGKRHANIAVRNVFLFQHRQRGHDFGNTGFIIGTQQRFAVGGDKRLPQQLMQHREHHRRQHFITDPQRNITAAIVFNNLRIDVFAAEIRSGINMGDKTDRRNIAADVRREGAHHRSLLAQRDVNQPHCFQLLFEQM